jgi:plastocyanin
MKRILLLLTAATVIVLALAPVAWAQVWPSAQPPQQTPTPEPAPAPTPTPTPAPATPAPKKDNQQTVSIQDFNFSPATLTVDTGTTVTWQNQGNASHTVTADDGSFDSKTLQPGQSFSHTFESPETVTYHCEIHPRMMTGSVTVSGGGATTPASKATTQPSTQPSTVGETTSKQASSGGSWLPTALVVGLVVLVVGALGWWLLRRAS